MEKFSIFINDDRHRCTRCQCDSFNKIVYPVAILFKDTFELHCCDCNEIQSFDFECWSNMRIRPYEVEFSSGGVLDKVLKRLSEMSDEEIINSTFDIVEPEVEEWIKCESSDDVILKFWTGKRVRFDNGFFKYEGCINDKNTTMTTFIIDVGNKVENYERWQYLKK